MTCVGTSAVGSVFISVCMCAWMCWLPDISCPAVADYTLLYAEHSLSCLLACSRQLPPEALTSLPRQHTAQKHLGLVGSVRHAAPRRAWRAHQPGRAKYMDSSTVQYSFTHFRYYYFTWVVPVWETFFIFYFSSFTPPLFLFCFSCFYFFSLPLFFLCLHFPLAFLPSFLLPLLHFSLIQSYLHSFFLPSFHLDFILS